MTHSTSIQIQPAVLEAHERSRETSKSRQARGLHELAKDQAEHAAPTQPGCPAAKINAHEATGQTDKL